MTTDILLLNMNSLTFDCLSLAQQVSEGASTPILMISDPVEQQSRINFLLQAQINI